MLLLQMGIAADVTFLSYPIMTRYADMDEALADCRALYGEGWDEARRKVDPRRGPAARAR